MTDRSSIRDVYPDKRCGIICSAPTTPSPAHYSPVPPLDRLRMSMPNPPTSARLRGKRGAPLGAVLRSSANLAQTLRDIEPRSPRRLLTPL